MDKRAKNQKVLFENQGHTDAINFAVRENWEAQPTDEVLKESNQADLSCSFNNPDECVVCGIVKRV